MCFKLYTNYTLNPTLRVKESKRQRVKETKRLRVKETKRQRVKETEAGARLDGKFTLATLGHKETKRQRAKDERTAFLKH